MGPSFEWHHGPISGRLILFADGALWPRVELFSSQAGQLVLAVITAPDSTDAILGPFSILAEAQAAAELVLLRLTREPWDDPPGAP